MVLSIRKMQVPNKSSTVLTFLSFIVVMVPTDALWYPPTDCSSVRPYSGDLTPSGQTFTANWGVCEQAISRVMERRPNRSGSILGCSPHSVSYRGVYSLSGAHIYNLVRCPAVPDDVWVSYDGLGYGIFYVPNREDVGCNFGDKMVAGLGIGLGMNN